MDDSELQTLIHHLEHAAPESAALSIARLETSDDPTALIVAALLGAAPSRPLARATQVARTTRERQLVAISVAYVAGDRARVDELVREHLVDHHDNPILAWIVADEPLRSRRSCGHEPPWGWSTSI